MIGNVDFRLRPPAPCPACLAAMVLLLNVYLLGCQQRVRVLMLFSNRPRVLDVAGRACEWKSSLFSASPLHNRTLGIYVLVALLCVVGDHALVWCASLVSKAPAAG